MKKKTIFECKVCGARSAKWQGRCNSCGSWDSFVEIEQSSESHGRKRSSKGKVHPVQLKDVDSSENYRIKTNIKELDRVLGGGIVPGSLVLVGGDPGIGKSTLMLQMAAKLILQNPLFVTGEESVRQIKLRAERLEGIPPELTLLAETNLEQINSTIENTDCGVAIVDSIQSVFSDMVDAAPGSVMQVRECASLLIRTAKNTNKPIFLIGHVTKEGVIAGPKILEHMVDTVLQFEGEKTYSYRILRSLKNRFGSTNEIGIFDMSQKGLREVENPSELFLAKRSQDDSGISIVSAIEGTRPILLEVQALVSPSGYSVPQRTSNGFDTRRLQMILAVLEKRLGVHLRQSDVFVNLAGGVYMNDPSLDLGVAAAIVSSARETPVDQSIVLIGEIGLTGEVRPVSNIESRIHEAEKLGFKEVVVPAINSNKLSGRFSIKIKPVERISSALAMIL